MISPLFCSRTHAAELTRLPNLLGIVAFDNLFSGTVPPDFSRNLSIVSMSNNKFSGGLPPGHPPVRSFLALPITTISGRVLGSMYFGHGEAGRFTERDEQIVKGIAAQAAAAMDNARW